MANPVDELFGGEPRAWTEDLPGYQKQSIDQLLAGGASFEDVAQAWLTAAASNTYRFGAMTPVGDKKSYLTRVKAEMRAYFCGDAKYETERAGLFGEKSPTRTLVVSSLAVAMAPHLGMAAPVLAPVIALLLASIGKISINAYCAATDALPAPDAP